MKTKLSDGGDSNNENYADGVQALNKDELDDDFVENDAN